MSWTDDEIDNVFEEAAGRQTFEYRPEYWKDIEKQLPVSKSRKPILWWITGGVFVIGMFSLYFVDGNNSSIYNNKSANQNASNLTSTNEKIVNSYTKDSKDNQASFEVEKNSTKNTSLVYNPDQLTRNSDSKSIETKSGIIDVKQSFEVNSTETTVLPQENQSIDSPENVIKMEESLEMAVIRTEESKVIETIEIESIPVRPLSFESKSSELALGDLKAKNNPDLRMFAELNGALGQAWTNNDSGQNLVNGSLGVTAGILCPINKFVFSAGLGFQATKLDNLRIQERTKVYGFGSNILENTYQFNSIYTVNLPLSLAYNTGRHSFEFGVNTSMKLFTSVLRTQTVDGNQTAYSKGIANVSLFNRFGIQPNLGYGFYVNEKVQIGVRGSIQLIQPLLSERFTGTKVKMPIEGQVYLKRTINF